MFIWKVVIGPIIDSADVYLLFSKLRIAPKKKILIPRLELLALLIGIRSLKFVSKELKLENTKITVWTHLKCVLNWIKGKKPLPVFVRNRLTEITREKNIELRYIHTKENSVDLPSRGLFSNDLKRNSLWWKGPEWLTHNQISWPTWSMPRIDEKILGKYNQNLEDQQLSTKHQLLLKKSKSFQRLQAKEWNPT